MDPLFIDIVYNKVYEAMEGDETDKDYLPNLVLAALPLIESQNFNEPRKSNCESEYYREEGNVAYKHGKLQKALVYYNQAMAYAPKGSLCLKLAYSNRSAVLFSAKKYKACEIDCCTALAIHCETPSALTEKLEKRISQARIKQYGLQFQRDKVLFQKYADEFFKLKSHNSDVPCVSRDVDIVIESGIPKVVAKRDIAAGTLVGLEKAFVSWAPNESNQYFSCHYCRKLGLNLFPCSGCVSAMFCSKQCEESCLAEYHTDECKIASSINNITPHTKWILKAILKLKNKCASWDELISMSYDYGHNRIEKGTVNDIFDGENPSSLLSFHKERHFMHGALFNSALICATNLYLLQNLQSFMPEDMDRKLLATKAMARIMMYLKLNATLTTLSLVTDITEMKSIDFHKYDHFGLFPFIGKLKHSCMPNLQTLAVNNSIGLVAFEKIKAGTELTISHV